MKQQIKQFFLCGILMLSVSLAAQTKPAHYVGVWGNLGYSNLWLKSDMAHSVGGFGYGLGVGYQMKYQKFLLNTGLEFNVLHSRLNLDNFQLSSPVVSPYSTMTYHHNFYNYTEKNYGGFLTVPLLFGAQFKNYYFLIGGKTGINIVGGYKTASNIEMTVTDEELIGEFVEMPNHLLYTDKISGKGKLGFKPDFALSFETGMDLDPWLAVKPKRGRNGRPRRKTFKELLHYRIGVFVDYGLNNINNYAVNNANNGGLITFEDGNVTKPIAFSVLGTESFSQNKLNSLFAGVKFSIMYGFEKPKPKAKPQGRPKPPVRKPQPKTKPQPQIMPPSFLGVIYDIETKQRIIDAQIKIKTLDETQTLYENSVNAEPITIKNIKSGTYRAAIEKQGYMPYNEEFTFEKDTVCFYMQAVKQGEKIILRNLFFATNQTTVLSTSETALEDLYRFLTNNPDVRIKIIGHTDYVGTEDANFRLSEGRANSVRNSMIAKGIDAHRIEWEGRGESEPIATNETEEGRAENRRVEIEILSL